MTRTRTNGNSFSNSVVTGTEGKSATLKSLCSSVYRVDTKTYQPSDIRWLFIQVRLNCYIICKTLPSEKKKGNCTLSNHAYARTYAPLYFVRTKRCKKHRRISGRRFSPYFSEGEKRRPEIRLRFAGYKR